MDPDDLDINHKELSEKQFCIFCNQEVKYSPLKEMEDYDIKVYFCHKCDAEYLFWKNSKKLISWSLYFKVKNKLYRWTKKSNFNEVTLWLIKNPGAPSSRKNEDLKSIKTIKDHIPEVNPNNIKKIVSAYLLFI